MIWIENMIKNKILNIHNINCSNIIKIALFTYNKIILSLFKTLKNALAAKFCSTFFIIPEHLK